MLTICFLGFLFPLGHISLLLIHLLICLVQLKCVHFYALIVLLLVIYPQFVDLKKSRLLKVARYLKVVVVLLFHGSQTITIQSQWPSKMMDVIFVHKENSARDPIFVMLTLLKPLSIYRLCHFDLRGH